MIAMSKTHEVGKYVCLLLFILWANGCQLANPQTSSSVGAPATPFFVVLDGPWVLAADPSDATKLVAISPQVVSHAEPYVEDAGGAHRLPTGVYEISISNKKSASPAPTANSPVLYPVNAISANTISVILASKGTRYAIKLPLPDAYGSSQKRDSRIGVKWPVENTSTYKEDRYTTAISLRYDQADLTKLALAGTPDDLANAFQPGAISVQTPATLRVVVEAHYEDTGDPCSMQSKQAFVAVNSLFNLGLYVDFPQYPKPCQDRDPQNPRGKPPIDLVKALDKMKSQIQDSGTRPITQEEVKAAKEVLELVRVALQGTPSETMAASAGKISIEVVNRLESLFSKAVDKGSTAEQRTAALKALAEVRTALKLLGPGGKDCKTAVFDVSRLVQ